MLQGTASHLPGTVIDGPSTSELSAYMSMKLQDAWTAVRRVFLHVCLLTIHCFICLFVAEYFLFCLLVWDPGANESIQHMFPLQP